MIPTETLGGILAWFEPDVLSLSLVLIPPHPRLPLSPWTEPLLPPKVNILVCRGSQAASPLIIHLTQGRQRQGEMLIARREARYLGRGGSSRISGLSNHSLCIPTTKSAYQHPGGNVSQEVSTER